MSEERADIGNVQDFIRPDPKPVPHVPADVRNGLPYWFPKLQAAGVPVPATEIIDAGENWWTMGNALDDPEHEEAKQAIDLIRSVADKVRATKIAKSGQPFFLRTDQGSGKHEWSRCCHVTDPSKVDQNIAALVEWSHLVDLMGLSHRYWCVREMIPVAPIAQLPKYGMMPLVPEVRTFVGNGRIQCMHPYWPIGSIRDGLVCRHDRPKLANPKEEKPCGDCEAQAKQMFSQINDVIARSLRSVTSTARQVAEAFAGGDEWSVDILIDSGGKGWVTDMALKNQSYHYPKCNPKLGEEFQS